MTSTPQLPPNSLTENPDAEPPRPAPTSFARRVIKWVLRIAITGAIFFLIFRKMDFSQLAAALRATSPLGYAASVAAFLFCFVIWAWRYGSLLGGFSHSLPFFWRLRVVLVGAAAAQALPSGLLGDVVRYRATRRKGIPGLPIALVLLVEKLLTLWGWCLVPLLAWPFLRDDSMLRGGIFFFTACAAAGVVAFAAWPHLAKIFARLLAGRAGLAAKFQQVSEAITRLRADGRLLAVATLQSILFDLFIVLSAWILGLAMGIHIHPAHYALLMAIVYITGTVPMTPFNLGVREGIFATYLAHLGLASGKELGLAYGVLYLGIMMSSIIPGAVIYLIKGEN